MNWFILRIDMSMISETVSGTQVSNEERIAAALKPANKSQALK